jgi:tetratricopeptide (TPR) repeat protein
VDENPKSGNAYDSLGEAYATKGDKKLAIQSYSKSLELDPTNENAKHELEVLKGSPRTRRRRGSTLHGHAGGGATRA